MNLGQWIVIGISVFFLGWYFGANLYNRRLGLKTYRWLRKGLSVLGNIDQAGWLGSSSSGARLQIGKPKKPFRTIETSFFLETREILPWWAFNRLLGKRENVTIRITLHKAPIQTFVVCREIDQAKVTQKLDQTFKKVNAAQGFCVLISGQPDDQWIGLLNQFLESGGKLVQRIILQPQPPHCVVTAALKPLLNSPAEAFFKGVASLWSYPEN